MLIQMGNLKVIDILNGHWPLLRKLKIMRNIAHLGLRHMIFIVCHVMLSVDHRL